MQESARTGFIVGPLDSGPWPFSFVDPFLFQCIMCSCSVNHGKDLFVATIILSESEFLGENCHLSELAEEGEEENQLKVS